MKEAHRTSSSLVSSELIRRASFDGLLGHGVLLDEPGVVLSVTSTQLGSIGIFTDENDDVPTATNGTYSAPPCCLQSPGTSDGRLGVDVVRITAEQAVLEQDNHSFDELITEDQIFGVGVEQIDPRGESIRDGGCRGGAVHLITPNPGRFKH